MEKVVLGTKEIIEYRGKCPDCGKPQSSQYEVGVDVPCWSCSMERKEKRIKEKNKFIIGSTITEVYGKSNLTMIRVKTIDGKDYEITSDFDSDDGSWLEINEKET